MRINTIAKRHAQEVGTEGMLVLAFLAAVMLSVYTAIAAMICIIIYTMVKKSAHSILRSASATIFIVAFCILALVVSIEYRNTAGIYIAIAVAAILYVSLFMRKVMTPGLFEKGLNICCYMSWLCFGVAMLQRIIMGDGARQNATFINANYYAMVIEFVIIFCMHKLFKAKDKTAIMKYGATILINIAGLYMCDCRSSFVVLAVMLPVMLLLNKKYKALAVTLGIFAACAVCMFVIPELLPRADKIPKDLAKRMSIWNTALRGIADNPMFGRGGNAYASIYEIFGGHKTVHAHNILLDMLLNYGVAGTILLGTYFLNTGRSVYRVYKSPQNRNYGILALMICLSVFIHGITDITVFGPQTAPIFMFVLSIAGLSQRQENMQTAPARTAIGSVPLYIPLEKRQHRSPSLQAQRSNLK